MFLCDNSLTAALLGNFDDILKEADKLLSNWKIKNQRDWGKRMEMINTNWEASRKCLFEQMLKVSSPNVQKCCRCNTEAAIFRCSQCVYNNLCSLCDEAVHCSNPLHDREAFLNGFYQPIKPTLSVNADSHLVTVSKCVISFHFLFLIWMTDSETDRQKY